MIAIDTNILIAALVKSQGEHERVRRWLDGVSAPLTTTQTNIAESLRLLTHPRVFPRPLALKMAVAVIGNFFSAQNILVLEESATWWQELPELLVEYPGLKGNEIFDARIALCLRHNGVREICTFDADFAKYPFLKIVRV